MRSSEKSVISAIRHAYRHETRGWILKYFSLESDNEYPHLKWERTETDEQKNTCRTLQWITDLEKEMGSKFFL